METRRSEADIKPGESFPIVNENAPPQPVVISFQDGTEIRATIPRTARSHPADCGHQRTCTRRSATCLGMLASQFALIAHDGPDDLGRLVGQSDSRDLHGERSAGLVGAAMCSPAGAARMAAGHNAFRDDGSRTTPRARGALAEWVSPFFGSTGWLRYVRVALPKLVGGFRLISTRPAGHRRGLSRTGRIVLANGEPSTQGRKLPVRIGARKT